MERGRVEVALQCDLALRAARGFAKFDQPVDADALGAAVGQRFQVRGVALAEQDQRRALVAFAALEFARDAGQVRQREFAIHRRRQHAAPRSEEHTSELQSLMRISYAVFCLKKKKKHKKQLKKTNK